MFSKDKTGLIYILILVCIIISCTFMLIRIATSQHSPQIKSTGWNVDIQYYKDERSGLCFASKNGYTLTLIPCTDKLMQNLGVMLLEDK